MSETTTPPPPTPPTSRPTTMPRTSPVAGSAPTTPPASPAPPTWEVVPELAGVEVAVGSPVAVVAAVTGAVAGLGQTLWAARAGAELVDMVRALERLRSVLDAVELGVIAEVHATGAAAGAGWASTRDFVTAVTGGRKGEGRRLVALATAVTGERAATGAALGAGAISRAQAEAVLAAVDRLPANPGLRAAAEQLLLEQAVSSDATDLARAGGYLLERLDPDGAEARDERALDREERAAHAGRFLSITPDGIGGVRVRGRGTVEDAAHLKAALFPLATPQPAGPPGACGGIPTQPGTRRSRTGQCGSRTGQCGSRTGQCGIADCAHDGRDPREHGTRLWDALIEAARLLSGTDLLPTSHGTRPRIGILIDLTALQTGLGHGTLDTGETLSAAAIRTLACDAEILPYVLGSRSQILDVGRTSRLVTLGLWLALLARDRHCAFPGCSRPPAACDAHHITHWADGGHTALPNLVILCRTHHTMLHTTPWQVRLNPHDQHPEFLPPPHLDPTRTPRRHQPLRT